MPFSMFVTELGLELELEVEREKASEKESEKDLRTLDGSCRICVGSCSCVVFMYRRDFMSHGGYQGRRGTW
jgi:hypothetical protein